MQTLKHLPPLKHIKRHRYSLTRNFARCLQGLPRLQLGDCRGNRSATNPSRDSCGTALALDAATPRRKSPCPEGRTNCHAIKDLLSHRVAFIVRL